MNISEKAGSSWSTRIVASFSSRTIEQADIVVAVPRHRGRPARHPSPRKSRAPKMAITASLPALRDDVELDLAFVDIKDRVTRVTLRESPLVFTVFRNRPAFSNLCQKELGIEKRLQFRSHTALLRRHAPPCMHERPAPLFLVSGDTSTPT